MSTISSLLPDTYRIELTVKIIELIIALKTKHENSGSLITIYEYLVADESGCIILNTKSEIKVDSIYTISNGHTHTVDGYLRLYANQFEPSNSQISQANIENNCSLVRLERKLL